MIPAIPNANDILPTADVLRRQLADARQAVALLDGLLKLHDRVARRRGRPVATTPTPSPEVPTRVA